MNGIAGIYSNSLTALSLPSEAQVRINQQRALFVRLTDDSGNYVAPGGGTTDSASWTVAVSSFNPVGGVFNDSATVLSSGTQGTARLTNNRAMHVNVRDHLGNEATLTGNSLNVNVTNGAAGGTSMADKAAFTVGTTNGTPAFGLARTDQPDLVVDATGVSFASTLRRGLHVNLRTQTGTELLGQKAMAGSVPVVLASDQAAFPVTVTGTVTANAGTNLNTSLLALDTSVNGILLAQGSTTSTQKGPIVQGAVTTSPPTYTTAQTSPLSLDTSGNLRVAVLNTPAVSQSGTWNIGTVTTVTTVSTVSAVSALTCAAANAKVDIGLINAVTPLMGSGVMGTGSLRVTIASNNDPLTVAQATAANFNATVVQATASNFNAQVVGSVASAAADSGNPVKVGGVYLSGPGTAATTGNRVNQLVDAQGSQVVVGAPVAWVNTQLTTITASVSETTIVTAGAAGVFNDLAQLILTNSSATACSVTIKDATAGTNRMIIDLAANGGAVIPFPVVNHPQAVAANNWTATCGTSVTSIHITAITIQRK